MTTIQSIFSIITVLVLGMTFNNQAGTCHCKDGTSYIVPKVQCHEKCADNGGVDHYQ